MREHPVKCTTLTDELRRHQLPPPAVALIDIEGLDCEVVEELDGCEFPPHVLMFEHCWCAKDRYEAALRRVQGRTCAGKSLGYGDVTHPRWSDVAFFRTPLGDLSPSTDALELLAYSERSHLIQGR